MSDDATYSIEKTTGTKTVKVEAPSREAAEALFEDAWEDVEE